jgi:hypothetical protein
MKARGFSIVVTTALTALVWLLTPTATHATPPTITTQPANASKTVGESYTFSVAASGTGPLTYQWKKDGSTLSDGTTPSGSTISGATTAFLAIVDLASSDAGSYEVVVSNLDGSDTSQPATLTVGTPPAITLHPDSITKTLGENASFVVSATGSSPLSYQWYKDATALSDGGDISGATSSVLAIATVAAVDAGSYYVVVSNSYGTESSDTAFLTVDNCAPTPSGLVSWWRGEFHPSQAIAIGSNTGILTNGVTFSPGKVGMAFVFDGVDDYIETPVQNMSFGTGDFTLEGWIQTSSTKSKNAIASFDNYSPGIYVLSTGELQLYPATGAGSGFNDGDWHHFAIVCSGGAITYYKDGSSIGTATFGDAINPTKFYIGHSGFPGEQFTGMIDDLALYSRAFAPAEIQSIFIADSDGKCLPPTPPSIIAQPANATNAVGGFVNLFVTATGTAPLHYQWYKNDVALSDSANLYGSTATTLSLNNVTLADAGNFKVVITNSVGSVTSVVATVTIVEPVIITTYPQNSTNNVGATVTFNVNASGTLPFTVAWWKDGTNLLNGSKFSGVNTTNLTVNNAQLSDAGIYHVLISNGGSVATASAILEVMAFPQILLQPGGQTNKAGTSADFKVVASGGALKYRWKKGTAFLSGNLARYSGTASDTLSIRELVAADAGSYTVVVSNSLGSVTSSVAKLGVIDPAILIHPFSQDKLLGSTVQFTVQAGGTAPLVYQWKKDNTNPLPNARISGLNSNILTISNIEATDFGGYKVVVSNSKGSVTSVNAQMGLCTTPSIVTQPISKTKPPGSAVTFSVVAAGGIPLTYQWKKDGADIYTIDNSNVLTLTNLTYADAGAYSVVVTNEAGSVTSTSAILTISNALPTVSIVAPANNSSFAAPASISLTANAADSDGKIDRVEFYVNGNLAVSVTNNSPLNTVFSVTKTNVSAATYNIHAIAYDELGGMTSSSSINVNVTADCVLPPSGILAWWRADGNADDFFGRYDGTLLGGASATGLGKVGTGFWFDGIDDVVEVASAPALNFGANAPMTVELWAYRSGQGGSMTLLGKRDGCGLTSPNYELSFHADLGLVFGGGLENRVESGADLPLNEWAHIVGTFDGTTFHLYRNGDLVGTETGVLGPPVSSPLKIGGSGSCNPFQGSLDEVAIYNRALSQSEIRSIYASGVVGKCQAPIKVAGAHAFGGAGDQRATAISVAGGSAYVSGVTGANGDDGMIAKFALPNISGASSPTWSTSWPGQAGGDRFNAIAVSADGVFVAGDSYSRTTDSAGTKESKGMIVKFPFSGTNGAGFGGSAWDKQTPAAPGAFSISGDEVLHAVTTVTEGGVPYVYTTGSGESSLNNSGRLFLSKMRGGDSTIMWTVTDGSVISPTGNTSFSSGRAVAAMNGFIYVAGRSDDSAGTPTAIVRKYDPQGNLIWSHSREAGQFNGIAAFGNAIYTVGTSSTNSFLIEKRDENGQVLWTRYYSRGAGADRLNAVIGLGSRIYTVGSTANGTSGGTDAVILELDPATGDLYFTSLHGGFYDDEATGVATDGTDLFVVGKMQPGLSGGTEALILRLQVAQPILPLEILTTSLSYGESNKTYTAVLSAAGGSPEYSWSVAANGLPPGLSLSENGVISGIPTTNGSFTFTVQVEDSGAVQQTATQTLSIDVLIANDLPVVAITTPSNGSTYTAPANISLAANATDSHGISRVYFYKNGEVIGSDSDTPYLATVNNLPAGSYSFTAIAHDTLGATTTSSPISVRVNEAGTTVIDFEALDTTSGDVSGGPLNDYLGGFGVYVTNETLNARLIANSESNIRNGNDTEASSGRNLFTQVDVNGKVSYTIGLQNNVASFGFTRAKLVANRGISHPFWRATAYDRTGIELSSVGEDLINTYSDYPAQTFTLYGPDIGWVRIEADNRNFAAFSSPLLDDFVLSTVVGNIPPSVTITDPSAVNSFTAPADISVTASASDSDGTIQQISFYLGTTWIATATTNPATVTLSGLAPGTYQVRAVARDNGGAIRSSLPRAITVVTASGVKVINFDGLDASSRNLGGTTLSNYLATYGVRVSAATPGARVEATDAKNLAGGSTVTPASPNNVLTEVGVSGAVFYTLRFEGNYQKVRFTRPALISGSSGVSHPGWRARAFNSSGTELGSVSEPLVMAFTNVPPRTFDLILPDIAWVRFESDGLSRTLFPALLIDDLILDSNSVASALSVVLREPSEGAEFTAPASITLLADASSTLSSVRRVEFYAGPALIGSATTSPYTIPWTNVLAGSYVLKARMIDNADNAIWSTPRNITVNQGVAGNATLINFDDFTSNISNYLAQFDITVTDVSDDTQLQVLGQSAFLAGSSVTASSSPNVFTQTGESDTMSFTLQFAEPLQAVQFTRPKLRVGASGITHPEWTARAYDAAGVELDSVGEEFLFSYVDVDSTTFSLQGDGIYTVTFESDNARYAAFDAVLLDDFILTRSSANLPPVVRIVDPVSSHVFMAPADITITAEAQDFDGSIAQVSFYRGVTLLGTATTPPYSIQWPSVPVGRYTFHAVATDDDGATRASMPVTIKVDPAPDVFGLLSQPADQSAATGGTVTFSVTTTPVGTITYQWQFNGTDIPGATSSELVLVNLTAGDAGSYRVIVSTGGVNITSDEAVLTVLDAPVVTDDPEGQIADMGEDVTFTVTATGAEPLQYQWLLNGHPVSGATSSSLVLTGVQPSDAGNYSVVVKNAIGVTRSQRANLTVVIGSGAATFADHFADRVSVNPLEGAVIGDNSTATLETNEPIHGGKTGGQSIWYTWRASFSGVITLSTRGSSFDTLMSVYTGEALNDLSLVASDDDSGGFFTSTVMFNCVEGIDYHIAIDGYYGASGNVVLGLGTAGYRVLDVSGNDEQIPFITGHPASRSVLRGDTIELTVVATSQSAMTYQWSFNGTPLLHGTNSSLTISNFENSSVGRYTARVANEFGSVDSIPAVLQIIEADVEDHETIASRDKFQEAREVGLEPSNFRGSKHHTGNSGLTRGYTTTQVFSTVGATKEDGEPNHAGDAGGASEWYTYTTVTNGTLFINTDGSSFNTLLAVYTGLGFDFDSLTLAASDNSSSGSGGDRVRFAATAGTTYYIAVDGAGGASGTVNLNVNLGDAPSITSAPQSKTSFLGSSATFTVAAEGSTNFTYQWRFLGTNLAGANGTSYTRNSIQSGHAGAYTVVISNMINVVTSSPSASLTLATPVGITTPPTSRTVTAGTSTTLTVTPSGTSPYTYRWRLNGVNVAGGTNSSLTITSIQTTNAGDYTVYVTNIVGEVTSSAATVTVTVPMPSPTSHKQNLVVTNSSILLSGTAATNARIAAIHVQVNDGSFSAATGSNSWSKTINLAAGTNTIGVKAIDASGFESAVSNRIIFNYAQSLLTLQTNGVGDIKSTPNGAFGTPTNQAPLVIGKYYKVTASVGKGTNNSIFTNWTDGSGVEIGTNAMLMFQMRSNTTVRANFIDNPFLPYAGTYNGLFNETNSNGTRHESAGFITIKTTAKLGYSTKIALDGDNLTTSGTLYTPGNIGKVILRTKQGKSPLTLRLMMDFNDHITGTLSCDDWTAEIYTHRWVTNNMLGYSNYYTMVIPGFNDPANGPSGFGSVAFSVSHIGKIGILQGYTADGQRIQQGGIVLSKNGEWPLFSHLYKGAAVVGVKTNVQYKGSIMGWITIETNTPAPINTNLAPQGSLLWTKKAWTNQTYQAGFTNSVAVLGSLQKTPPTGQRVLNLPLANVVFAEGNLTQPFTNELTLRTNNAFIVTLPNTYTLKPSVVTKSGLFKGSFGHSDLATNKTMFYGVMLQDYNYARGMFVGTNKTGLVKWE